MVLSQYPIESSGKNLYYIKSLSIYYTKSNPINYPRTKLSLMECNTQTVYKIISKTYIVINVTNRL